MRIHRLEPVRRLLSAEAGHAVPRLESECAEERKGWRTGPGMAMVMVPQAAAGVFDPTHGRWGEVVITAANTNLLHPRTTLPTLRGEHIPGVHWLLTLLLVDHLATDPNIWQTPVATIKPAADGVHVELPGATVRLFADPPPSLRPPPGSS